MLRNGIDSIVSYEEGSCTTCQAAINLHTFLFQVSLFVILECVHSVNKMKVFAFLALELVVIFHAIMGHIMSTEGIYNNDP